jgi:hypothetical protein
MKKFDLVSQFDHVIWSGDFNYRLNWDRKHIESLLTLKNFQGLLAEDQLG